MDSNPSIIYRGRIAPTPTGHLHVGHGRTFWIAHERARQHNGRLILRNEDLDPNRCHLEFVESMFEDLRWLGITWDEGPDVGGPHAPYDQSQRLDDYRQVWRQLNAAGAIYPSPHSRKDVELALLAPHHDDDGDAEPIFPPSLRPTQQNWSERADPGAVNWRFWVPDAQTIAFSDGRVGLVERTAAVDFGDFLVWRKDGFPSYELAVVADDHAMDITEVVRGEDLLTSTARQLLLYTALGWKPPRFYHCPLVRDDQGRRLAKRSGALALRTLREQGRDPEQLTSEWELENAR